MQAILGKLITYLRLGLANVARIVVYRLLCRIGFYARLQPVGMSYPGPFWNWSSECRVNSVPGGYNWYLRAGRVLSGELPFFSSEWRKVGFPPAWCEGNSLIHWTKVNEFSLPAGDIKNMWEPSRFEGLLILALAWLTSGDSRMPAAMERWMESWVEANPANAGVQWKCGQEAGIRLMHVLLVSELLHDHAGVSQTLALKRFAIEHCRRIAPTMLYAVAQDNNHGTTEAAALYMAGTWLRGRDLNCVEAESWQKAGRDWIENRIRRLVMGDGSFSQHSVNYHRLMLDTVTMVECWRQRFSDTQFSAVWYQRCCLATEWLDAMVDPTSGDAPNLGANDGARIFIMHGLPYRDLRPSVQSASVVFKGLRRYTPGKWDEPLFWLKRETPHVIDLPARLTKTFPQGGYVRLAINGRSWGVLRLPVFRFRPSHADALNFDLWRDGINWLRDGGTYSYNTEDRWLNYFPGTASHSTVQFDDRDQMPRLGRFLFGRWLHCKEFVFDQTRPCFVRACYVDSFRARHCRSVTMEEDACLVVDEISGFEKKATLRWRLPQMEWTCQAERVSSERCVIEVAADVPVIRAELVHGFESRHYGELSDLPVFEIDVAESPARLKTIIRFTD